MSKFSQRGSALIEAAFVLPVFILLACGSADFARTLYLGQVTAATARAGVHRALALTPQTIDLNSLERAAVADAGATGITAKATRLCACTPLAAPDRCEAVRCSGQRIGWVRVETSAEFSPLLRYPAMLSLSRVRGEATMRVE